MAIPKSQPIRYTPKGLCDAFDATDAFPGASQSLVNLIFDSSNPELMVPRPGVFAPYDLGLLGFAGAGFVSVHVEVGTRIYGMVATTRNAGHDEPFCIDTATGSVVVISGVTAANTPASPATAGEWIPPTMASIGVYLIVTHPGFNGVGANFFGVIDLTNPAAPAWTSANTAVNVLTAVPTAVANLNNRAYYAVKNQLQYSDVLLPLTRTNATQALVVGDTGPLNALAGLPVQTTSSGVISSLTAFKTTQTWQVTGDPVSNDLMLSFVSLTVGTTAPRSIAQSPAGLYFLSSGGPYFIDPLGTLRLVTHRAESVEPDVQAPFINAVTPTRWAGAYNSSVYRVCGPTVVRGQQVVNDYWFDERKRRWNGPHSFAYDCAGAIGSVFALSSVNHPGLLIASASAPGLSTVYTDLGSPFNVAVLTATLPKVGDMCEKQVCESQIELGGTPLGVTYAIAAQNEQGVILDAVTIAVPATGLPTWGSGILWGGGALWSAAQNIAPKTYPIPWTAPLVFEKMQLQVTAPAGPNVQIGTFFARYQKTGYMVIFP